MHFFKRYPFAAVLVLLPFLAACAKHVPPPPPSQTTVRVTLSPGDTLGESLSDLDISSRAQKDIIAHLEKIFNLRRCRAGDYYEVMLDSSARDWSSFYYYPPGIDYFAVKKSTDGTITEHKTTRSAHRELATSKGTIHASLWESLRAKKIDPDIIMSFADVFAWQIDFLTDTRNGDTYRILWEQYVSDDGRVINRQILAAQYTLSGEIFTAFLFDAGHNQREYYSPEGKSLRSAFLKAPLQFRRISSYFSLRRYHPVLKTFRPHLGIDYAAPVGTPVSSIGEGTVLFAGREGGFGNFIKVRHANGFVTCYGHLSRYGQGIRSGVHVRQGQLIGYVGKTGLATGPHLDFRIEKDGRFINYLRLKLPPVASVEPKDKERFNILKKSFFTQLARIH